jgi:NAD(P)-dependent dehydrogenase (short-subunit alcohol dehydrogenase family)
LVVGGTRGLGRALVRLLSKEGREVSVLGKRAPEASEKLDGVKHWSVDLLDSASLSRALDEVQKRAPVSELALLQRFKGAEDWSAELDTSVTATKRIIESLSPSMPEGGSIVLVGSIIAELVADSTPVGYHVAKAALHHMARFYAAKLGPRGVRVNAVSAATFLKDESKDFYLKNKELLDLYRRMIPLGRMGTADEIAEAAAFLLGPRSSFITGQVLTVDGGLTIQSQEALARKLVPVETKK